MDKVSCPPGVCCLDYELFRKERGFILDGVAVDSNARGYGKINPKLCDAIPPYNAQTDPYTRFNFHSREMRKLLKRTDQMLNILLYVKLNHVHQEAHILCYFCWPEVGMDQGGTSNSGWLVDYFYKYGPAQRYLAKRNVSGAGHSRDHIVGHRGFLSELKPMNGYNGRFGFRRNTPSLRQNPSIFGPITCLPLH
ncbi:sperm microtubule associated protein 1-like [Mustelus asterias]